MRPVPRLNPTIALVLLGLLLATPAAGQRIRLKDGRILDGKVLPITGVADSPVEATGQDGQTQSTPILVIDDDLRRTFVPKLHLAEIIDQAPEPLVRIKPWQSVARSGGTLGSVGPSLRITPFDRFGRRIYEMRTRNGPLAVVQGITEITPRYARVEGLLGQPKSIVWDMRLATTSIPRDILAEILDQAVTKDNPDDWLQIVRFYLQAERFQEARQELEKLIARFPEKQELQTVVLQLRQRGAQRILREIQLRREAGQHQLVSMLLQSFPTEQVAGETLQQVRETIAAYQGDEARMDRIRGQLTTIVAEISDPRHRDLVESIAGEISAHLSFNTIDRLAPFAQLADDRSLAAGQRAALAISGWILGAEGASEDLAVAVALVDVRKAVREYLIEPLAHRRTDLLNSVRSMEGVSVDRVAQMFAHMTPPWEIADEVSQGHGVYELTAPGKSENGDFRYLVQLPGEYDPYRHYPTIVALNGAYNTPRQELDFWAGSPPQGAEGTAAGEPAGPRRGHAMRHGYITLAVDWRKPQQYHYEYSLREHEAVLTSLRDAFRRFSIDTDRVFLTGHGMGGDAAWDFAQAHPDLWAGAIPFVAEAKKYVPHYWENAEFVPLYFVAGELDGKKMSDNASVLDKYLRKRFDTTVVEFLGRGHEPFHDEILALFDWMGRHARRGAPPRFACNTMRPWDNFFWWIEGQGFPGTVAPGAWPRPGARPTVVEGRMLKANRLAARTAAERTTLWLSRDLVDFSQPIHITFNGKKIRGPGRPVEPELEVLLEDVRTRGDRLRPFCAKVEIGR